MSGSQPTTSEIATAIGLDLLRQIYPSLNGAGVAVGQAEADASGGTATPPQFEPTATNYPGVAFTYYNGLNSTTTANDGTLGATSSHADAVASYYYGTNGVASGVSSVTVYSAGLFTTNLRFSALPKVVNMSFTYTSGTTNNAAYDAAAISNQTIFVAAAGNSGTPASPSTAYNVISVSSSTATVSIGAAGHYADKPDISAPGNETSYTAPVVSGAAAILVQAGSAGLSGWTNTEKSNAVDFRAIKALLLNGAVKPSDYFTNAYAPTATSPLSLQYGSGVVNVYNAVVNLYAGEDAAQYTATIASGTGVYSSLSAKTLLGTAGWNLGTLTASRNHDAVDGYAMSLTAGTAYVATITWAATASGTTENLDKIDLYLYDEATGTLQASSVAALSSVQQIYFTPASAGRYDLFVRLEGSSLGSATDSYGLAFAETSVACFAAGTRIATPAGPVAIETLAEGNLVTLARCGGSARVRWVGRRSLVRPGPDTAPLRIAAGAFGPGAPARDLLLSPEHAVYTEIGGVPVLVPVRALQNGGSIAPIATARITYFHILLDRHDVLLADGLPCESLFDADGAGFDAPWAEQLAFDRPAALRVTQGVLVEALRQRLATITPARTRCAS